MTLPMLFAVLVGAADTCAVAVEFRVPSPLGHELAVVLESRDLTRRLPVAILISGAGPDDRNGYTAATSRATNEAFRTLSARLTSRGFAVVRFDEMGTGRSSGDYRRHATTETLAVDVAAIAAELRRRPEVDGARVSMIGYSEGGSIAGKVGAADPAISGIIMLAAPAWAGERIMHFQDSVSLADPYLTDDASRARRRQWLDSTARTRRETEAWYPYFLRYDPMAAYEQLRMPVLIIHGGRDLKVSAQQAQEIRSRLQAVGNRQVELQLLPDLGHALTDLEWSPLPDALSERVVSAVASWLSRTQGASADALSCRARLRW